MVGIVVVTYNRLELLKEVVESLRNQTYRDFKIIVVNNDSPDGTKDWLEHQSDIFTINQGNVGGAGGFYTGMKYVAENGFDYCWIMDDDVICQPDALEELMKGIQIKPDIGFVCSKVIGTDGRPMNVPDLDLSTNKTGEYKWPELLEKNMVRVRNATFVSVLFPIKMIQEFGLPIKEYFIWGDDSEYTSRISAKKDCYIVGNSQVLHKRALQQILAIETETNENRLKNFFYLYRNGSYTLLLRKHRKSYFRRVKYITKKILKLLVQGKWKKARIVFNSQLALINFKPEIQFPVK